MHLAILGAHTSFVGSPKRCSCGKQVRADVPIIGDENNVGIYKERRVGWTAATSAACSPPFSPDCNSILRAMGFGFCFGLCQCNFVHNLMILATTCWIFFAQVVKNHLV